MSGRALLTSTLAVGLAALLLAAAWLLLRPRGPALAEAASSRDIITPNADGDSDVTRLRYRLRRPATVSIYLLDAAGQRYYFRREKPRDAGEHEVEFSGIVEPFTRPGETLDAALLARVLPDGAYTWVVEAVEPANGPVQLSGPLTIVNADTRLPGLSLTVSPDVFSPNQDGLNDRATINVWLDKDVSPDGLQVSLIGPDGGRLPIPEKVTSIPFGVRGTHTYDYDAGIDQGIDPPPDGTYTIEAAVEDRLGQKMAVSTTLAIRNGGLPRADILYGDVEWSATTLVLGETLYFTLTVENYGTAPIRTSGPPSGTVYPSMGVNANTLGAYVEAGAWRVGINCETCQSDYPWRWALGTPETLTPLETNGEVHYYLLPGQRATVTGGIVLDQIVRARNPQYFWAGLIHEDVRISEYNKRVDPAFVTIVPRE